MARWKSMQTCVFNAHTSNPDVGTFLGYNKCPNGWCRVLLNREGYKTVPVKSIVTKAEWLVMSKKRQEEQLIIADNTNRKEARQ